jgi:hypothetical protein
MIDNEKGMPVNSTEHRARTASIPRAGLFAMLCGLVRVKGSGAPKISKGSGALSSGLILAILCISGAWTFGLVRTSCGEAAEAPRLVPDGQFESLGGKGCLGRSVCEWIGVLAWVVGESKMEAGGLQRERL